MSNKKQDKKDGTLILKFILIGDSGVGKTAILHRYVNDTFNSEDSRPSIVADFRTKSINLISSDNLRLKIYIWDTVGHEKFLVFIMPYFKDSHMVMMVYDVTDADSFNNVTEWLSKINETSFSNIILIGNKCDNERNRVISYEEGEQLAEDHQIPFYEVSACYNLNIEQMFLDAANTCSRNLMAKAVSGGMFGFRLFGSPKSADKKTRGKDHSNCTTDSNGNSNKSQNSSKDSNKNSKENSKDSSKDNNSINSTPANSPTAGSKMKIESPDHQESHSNNNNNNNNDSADINNSPRSPAKGATTTVTTTSSGEKAIKKTSMLQQELDFFYEFQANYSQMVVISGIKSVFRKNKFNGVYKPCKGFIIPKYVHVASSSISLILYKAIWYLKSGSKTICKIKCINGYCMPYAAKGVSVIPVVISEDAQNNISTDITTDNNNTCTTSPAEYTSFNNKNSSSDNIVDMETVENNKRNSKNIKKCKHNVEKSDKKSTENNKSNKNNNDKNDKKSNSSSSGVNCWYERLGFFLPIFVKRPSINCEILSNNATSDNNVKFMNGNTDGVGRVSLFIRPSLHTNLNVLIDAEDGNSEEEQQEGEEQEDGTEYDIETTEMESEDACDDDKLTTSGYLSSILKYHCNPEQAGFLLHKDEVHNSTSGNKNNSNSGISVNSGNSCNNSSNRWDNHNIMLLYIHYTAIKIALLEYDYINCTKHNNTSSNYSNNNSNNTVRNSNRIEMISIEKRDLSALFYDLMVYNAVGSSDSAASFSNNGSAIISHNSNSSNSNSIKAIHSTTVDQSNNSKNNNNVTSNDNTNDNNNKDNMENNNESTNTNHTINAQNSLSAPTSTDSTDSSVPENNSIKLPLQSQPSFIQSTPIDTPKLLTIKDTSNISKQLICNALENLIIHCEEYHQSLVQNQNIVNSSGGSSSDGAKNNDLNAANDDTTPSAVASKRLMHTCDQLKETLKILLLSDMSLVADKIDWVVLPQL